MTAELKYITIGQAPQEGDPQEHIYRPFLFYGDSGVGKTYLAAQFPLPLILACDPGPIGGTTSALKFMPKVIKIESYAQALNLIPQLKENAGEVFKTLVVDSISYFQRICMRQILSIVGREIPRFEEWNLQAERMRRFIENISELNCQVIFTATADIDKDEITGKIMRGPNLPGKLARELPQACDIVLRLYTVSTLGTGGKRLVKFRYSSVGDDIYYAKDCLNILEPDGNSNIEVFKKLK